MSTVDKLLAHIVNGCIDRNQTNFVERWWKYSGSVLSEGLALTNQNNAQWCKIFDRIKRLWHYQCWMPSNNARLMNLA